MNRRHVLFAVLVLLLALATPALNPASASKPVVYACSDGIDNDGDGATDHPDDSACIGDYDFSELPQCSDGVDNNGDGASDYPADETCFTPEDDDETDIPAFGPCADGYDNDRDGRVDYPADPGCRSESDQTESSRGQAKPR
jgi:hypothetical protein